MSMTDNSTPPEQECKTVSKPVFVFSDDLVAKGFSRDTDDALKVFIRSTPLEEGFLLRTNARLDEVFLNFFEEVDLGLKKMLTCDACLGFLRDIGSTVSVRADGSLYSPIWSRKLPENLGGYAELVKKLNHAVYTAEITGFYSCRKSRVGNATVKDASLFSHYYVTLGDDHRSRLLKWQKDGEVQGRIQEYHKQLVDFVGSVPKDRMAAFIEALGTQPSRFARPLAHAKWLLGVLEGFEAAGPEKDMNFLWRQAVWAPLGYPGWNSSLLKMGFDKFETHGAKIALIALRRELGPLRYQVPSRPLTEGRLSDLAQKLSVTGAESALCQRYATAEDIQEWMWKAPMETKDIETPDPLRHIIIGETLTRDDFIQTIAPTADAIWFEVDPDAVSRGICSFACASDPDSVPLLSWDTEEKRNSVTLGVWAYGVVFKDHGFTTRYNRMIGITSHPARWNGRKCVDYKVPLFVFEGPTKEGVQCIFFQDQINPRFRPQASTLATLARSLTLDQSVDPAKRLRGFWAGVDLLRHSVIALIDGQYVRYKFGDRTECTTGDDDNSD